MARNIVIDFGQNPLVPAVIVDNATGEVLMIAFMNEEAYRQTRETGRTHFWSRSRNKLWKKGESSGHEQIVRSMAINCEDNALLVTVDQIGAVCHTGHPTCFFREIEEDESLTVTTDRVFDPEVVYGGKIDPTKTWFEALEWLKSRPLEAESSTSRLLRTSGAPLATRVSDELIELAGVLDGSHVHAGMPQDLMTEGSQALYWLALVAIQSGFGWAEVRPDRALDSTVPDISTSTVAALLRARAEDWTSAGITVSTQSVHETMALVGQAARTSGVSPIDLIEHDLAEMRTRPYLRDYFEKSAN